MAEQQERRGHRRLIIDLPLEVRAAPSDSPAVCRTVSTNVSTGGIYFESDRDVFPVGSSVEVELTVPPGDGHFSYPGKVRGTGQITRRDVVAPDGDGPTDLPRRYGLAVEFREPLTLRFLTDH